MRDLSRDVRYAQRQLRRTPGFTLAAVLCIALGIGANTATFSFARAFLFRPPPVQDPARLTRLFIDWSSGLRYGSLSYPDFVDLRERNDVFSAMVVEAPRPFHLATGSRSERVLGALVTANFFSELGIDLPLGRGFDGEDAHQDGARPEAVLGHGAWVRRFGSDPEVVGRTISVDNHPVTVIGVAPARFTGLLGVVDTELWIPISMQPVLEPEDRLESRGSHWLNMVVGRLWPGVGIPQARASLNALMAHLIEEYPDTNTGKTIVVYPLLDSLPHPQIRGAFLAFFGLMFVVVGFVLVLACANVAGLLLARYTARRREVGIRLALGAVRLRLLRQLLVESTLLAALAATAGLGIAAVLIQVVGSFRPPTDLPIHLDLALDGKVLAFTALVALATTLLFGLLPAVQGSRGDLMTALKGSQGAAGRLSRLRTVLVVGQVALSMVLLVGAGLAVRSLRSAGAMDPGFDPDHLAVGSLDVGLQGYDEIRGRQLMERIEERASSLPGVQAVGLGQVVPLNFDNQQRGVKPEGFEVPEGSDTPSIDFNVVDAGYFPAMGIPALRGRTFDARDRADSPPVLVVNQTFADRFWPGEEAVGKRVRARGVDHEVIGVVATGRYRSLGEDPLPYMYLCLDQDYQSSVVLHVRTAGDPEAALPAIRRAVRVEDPTLPVSDLKTMHAALGFALLPVRMAAGVVSAFAALALLLAAVGLYALISYAVGHQQRELAVRMALGARPQAMLQLVLRRGMRPVVAGVILGAMGGFALARLMTAVLFGVKPADPAAYAAAVAVLAGAALVAVLVPARRAARIDPMAVLRVE